MAALADILRDRRPLYDAFVAKAPLVWSGFTCWTGRTPPRHQQLLAYHQMREAAIERDLTRIDPVERLSVCVALMIDIENTSPGPVRGIVFVPANILPLAVVCRMWFLHQEGTVIRTADCIETFKGGQKRLCTDETTADKHKLKLADQACHVWIVSQDDRYDAFRRLCVLLGVPPESFDPKFMLFVPYVGCEPIVRRRVVTVADDPSDTYDLDILLSAFPDEDQLIMEWYARQGRYHTRDLAGYVVYSDDEEMGRDDAQIDIKELASQARVAWRDEIKACMVCRESPLHMTDNFGNSGALHERQAFSLHKRAFAPDPHVICTSCFKALIDSYNEDPAHSTLLCPACDDYIICHQVRCLVDGRAMAPGHKYCVGDMPVSFTAKLSAAAADMNPGEKWAVFVGDVSCARSVLASNGVRVCNFHTIFDHVDADVQRRAIVILIEDVLEMTKDLAGVDGIMVMGEPCKRVERACVRLATSMHSCGDLQVVLYVTDREQKFVESRVLTV